MSHRTQTSIRPSHGHHVHAQLFQRPPLLDHLRGKHCYVPHCSAARNPFLPPDKTRTRSQHHQPRDLQSLRPGGRGGNATALLPGVSAGTAVSYAAAAIKHSTSRRDFESVSPHLNSPISLLKYCTDIIFRPFLTIRQIAIDHFLQQQRRRKILRRSLSPLTSCAYCIYCTYTDNHPQGGYPYEHSAAKHR